MKASQRHAIAKALDATGLEWRLRPGGKHLKVLLADQVVSVLPNGSKMNYEKVPYHLTRAIAKRVSEINGQAQ